MATIDLGTSVQSQASPATSVSLGNPEQEAVDLLKQLNPLYVQNFKMAMEAVAPGSAQTVADNIGSLLQGKIPLDMQRQIMQNSAELNLSQGRFGEAASFNTMRTLGKTSYDLQQQGLANLKSMMPQMPDIATLIQNQRAYDTQKAQMQMQALQFQKTFAEQQAEFQQKTALEKLQISLQQQQAANTLQMQQKTLAENARQYDTSLAWDQTVSNWNKQYEVWATTEQQKLARDLMNSKQQVASQASQATLGAINSRQNQAITGNTVAAMQNQPVVGTGSVLGTGNAFGSNPVVVPNTPSVSGGVAASGNVTDSLLNWLDPTGVFSGASTVLGGGDASNASTPSDLISDFGSVYNMFNAPVQSTEYQPMI